MATFLVWVITALTVAAAVFAVLAAVTGRAEVMADMPPDAVPWALPETGPVRSQDVQSVRFDSGFRGYRMDQVDAVLARLTADLAARDAAPAASPEPADDL